MRRELLPVIFDQRRLVVIKVHRACATIHEQLNYPFDFRGMVLNTERPLPGRWHRDAFIGKHARQCEASKTAANAG